MMSLYGRQIRLADVGESGQAKLSAATVALASTGFARMIEEQYLRGAGVGVGDGVSEIAVPDLGLRHAAPRDVADGAYAALVSIRRILGK